MHSSSRFLVAVLGAALGTLAALLPAPQALADKDGSGWTPLFNGKDLAGWDTWLGRPNKAIDVPGLKKDEKGNYTETVGLNKDPKKVYSVVAVDGQPAIRISGEIWGALTSQKEYENYHLRLEFKWGEKRWPPRENTVRDSGLLYHCVGPHGAGGTYWMQSFECQIQEHDCGDFWSVAGVLVDVEGDKKEKFIVYRKGGPKHVGVRSRIVRDVDHEKPRGEWNTIELFTVGGTAVHVVNGKPNLVLTNTRRKVGDKEEPLTRGKIQLQSEAAEVFYRNIAIRPLEKIPSAYLP